MTFRSMLFVPADSDRKLQKAVDSKADALIIDLEDSVAETRRPIARSMAVNYLKETKGKRGWSGFVRINPLGTTDSLLDLAAVVAEGVDGIILPKANGADDVFKLSAYLDVLEVRAGLKPQSIKVAAVVTETVAGMLNLASYSKKPPRLVGITWGAEDLSAAIGAVGNREDNGELSHLYLLARSIALLIASAADVQAIDTLYSNFKDPQGLEQDCKRSRRRGFLGRIAIHPDQVEVINRCFTPSETDITFAQSIVSAFAAQPETGVISIEGKMYDRPHLIQAIRTIDQARFISRSHAG